MLVTSGLDTKSALTAVENKILGVSCLVKNTDYHTKIEKLMITIMTN